MSLHEMYDVVVVGLGTTGSIAAISVAERGLKVLAIEKGNIMGGIGTQGAVMGYYLGADGGMFHEIDEKAYDQQIFIPTDERYPDFLHPESKAYFLEQRAVLAGVEIRYEAVVFDVLQNGKRVTGVKWKDNEGLHTAMSKYVIDCTGEADICALAGCETRRGRAIDQKCQPFSLCALKIKGGKLHSEYRDNGYINSNSTEDFSETILSVYRQKMYLHEKYDAEDFYCTIARQAGLREGRHIVGEENLSFEDFLTGKETTQPLFYAFSNFDTHNREFFMESDNCIIWNQIVRMRMLNFSVGISAEMLIPKGYSGIIVAGRCIGVEHDISPCVRMKKDMQKCGEAAAVLAYLAITQNTDVRAVRYKTIESILKKTGCLAVERCQTTFGSKGNARAVKMQIPEEKYHLIAEEMQHEHPGMGILWAIRAQKSVEELLLAYLNSEQPYLSIHSAFALALRGNRASLAKLREIVKKFNLEEPNSHALGAIYLCGLLRDEKSVEILMDVLGNCGHNYHCMSAVARALMSISEGLKNQEKMSAQILAVLEKHPDISVVISKHFNLEYSVKSELAFAVKNGFQIPKESVDVG